MTSIQVRIRFEEGAYWATVDEYPGVFATGDTPAELRASLEEGLALVRRDADPVARPLRLSELSGLPPGAAGVAVSAELSFG
ncbi:MAG TPA: type II toxin-antitoxin system HicB family antitoxin [Solirubrobacteraceae bacterium]|jgi:predicted RNase H-like HicB family nuclease|nr:type II toxin-antitoxin system HicB family antitoxin [Solirubrobacteraceae bacterium]